MSINNNLRNLKYTYDSMDMIGFPVSNKEYRKRVNYIRNNFLANSLMVTKVLTPLLFKTVREVALKLIPDKKLEVFIHPSDSIQAYSIGKTQDNYIIVLTSKIIKLLTQDELKFVVGHEIGHIFFEHNKQIISKEKLKGLYELNYMAALRASEITADRVGFICCNNNHSPYKTMIKLISGLNEQFIKFNIDEFLDQYKELQKQITYNETLYYSHPLVFIRMIALLWFSTRLHNEKGDINYNPSIDKKIMRELDRLDKNNTLTDLNKKAVKKAAFWVTIALFLSDKKLSNEEQTFLKRKFGPEVFKNEMSVIKQRDYKLVLKHLNKNLNVISFISDDSKVKFMNLIRSYAKYADNKNKNTKIITYINNILFNKV